MLPAGPVIHPPAGNAPPGRPKVSTHPVDPAQGRAVLSSGPDQGHPPTPIDRVLPACARGSRVRLPVAAGVVAAMTGLAAGCLALTGTAVAAPVVTARPIAAPAVPAGAVAAPGGIAAGGGRAALPGPVAAARVPGLVDAGRAGRGVLVSARLYLAGRDPVAEARFATAVSTPGDPSYGRFVSPAGFAALFGPTRAQVAAVTRWAKSVGLRVAGVNEHYVAVRGSAPAVGVAFGTRLDAYRDGARTVGFAPAGGVSVPDSLRGDVIAVLGLDTLAVSPSLGTAARPAARPAAVGADHALKCSSWWGQHLSRIPRAEGKTSADTAICGYTPQQLRSAYGITSASGEGASIAVVLDGSLPSMQADANRFFAAHHLAGFARGQFSENFGPGFAKSCDGSSDRPEEPLDVETAHIIAPAAKVVYVGVNCGSFGTPGLEQNFLDAETRIVDHHLANVETDSASIVESVYSAAMRTAYTKVFEQGAAEGIGFNFDAGDGGDETPPTFPASDPWATGVGATDLQIGRTGTVAGELGWGDTGTLENAKGTGYQQPPPGPLLEGTTGGRSVFIAEPSYQRGVVPAALATAGGTRPAHRVLPDVSAIGGATTGWLIGFTSGDGYQQVTEAGTSGSSPVVAALEADARHAVGHSLGFANPLLYRLRKTAGIRDILPPKAPVLVLSPPGDCAASAGTCLITESLDGSLRVTKGFDDVTGIGAVTSQFVTAIRHYLASQRS
jgi:subtilase family serine protease